MSILLRVERESGGQPIELGDGQITGYSYINTSPADFFAKAYNAEHSIQIRGEIPLRLLPPVEQDADNSNTLYAWALTEYRPDNDYYRSVTVRIVRHEKTIREVKFTDAYVHVYQEQVNGLKGVLEFELVVRQRRDHLDSIRILFPINSLKENKAKQSTNLVKIASNTTLKNVQFLGAGTLASKSSPSSYYLLSGSDVKEVFQFAKEHFSELAKSDIFGQAILAKYLYGGGEEFNIQNNKLWTEYMEKNTILKNKVKEILLQEMSSSIDNSCKYINLTQSMEIENGENITGYEYLHGTNQDINGFKALGATTNDVGFQIIGSISKTEQEVYDYDLHFQWNDLIDPNFTYTTDQVKAALAEKIPFADPKPYIIRIGWDVKGTYEKNPPSGWKSWLPKISYWPFD
ncbi:hypothetical protein [Paenibacillus elgii]|uniref:hypothetical protein n=1 Tax=Paenibacillus elgii TaxID=189691 RepID=UPI000248D6DC|nr:hypothetical protein [Paenibacillus elgii]